MITYSLQASYISLVSHYSFLSLSLNTSLLLPTWHPTGGPCMSPEATWTSQELLCQKHQELAAAYYQYLNVSLDWGKIKIFLFCFYLVNKTSLWCWNVNSLIQCLKFEDNYWNYDHPGSIRWEGIGCCDFSRAVPCLWKEDICLLSTGGDFCMMIKGHLLTTECWTVSEGEKDGTVGKWHCCETSDCKGYMPPTLWP